MFLKYKFGGLGLRFDRTVISLGMLSLSALEPGATMNKSVHEMLQHQLSFMGFEAVRNDQWNLK